MVGTRALALTGLLLAAEDASARGGYDTNHPDVRWQTLETDHFYFHWPESKRDESDPHWFTTRFTVAQLARIAEESYPKVCGQFDYFLDEKTHVVIYDQDEGWEGNGFAIAEWDWTGFAARWGPVYRQRGRLEFLSDVFVHEFAHIVSLKAYSPWSEASTGFQVGGMVEDEEWLRRWGWSGSRINIDLGVDAIVSTHTPFWWAEGGAEYWSHMAGYNFWGSSRDAFLRMSVLEDRVLSSDEWTTRIDKEGFEGERGYNHGYAFSLYLADRFRRDVISEMAAISGEHWHWDWDQVVEEATGVDADQLYADWRAHLAERYGAQAAAIEARGVVAGREIALVEPPWEAGGEDWEAMTDAQRHEAMDGDTAYQELPAWSPDGRSFAWFDQGLNVRRIRPEEWGAIGGTYVDEDDDDALKAWDRATVSSDYIQYFRIGWGPDGDRFVATSNEDLTAGFLMDAGLTFNADGYNWSQLVIGTLDDDGRRLKLKLKPIPNTLRAVEAAWSPDGGTIAFSRYGDGTHEIWITAPDGTGQRRLTDFGDGTQVQGIDWSPDGTHLLVSLFRNFQQDLWLLEVDNGAWTRLTDSAPDETDPSFGPDGRVWFSSDLDGVYNVYALDPETRKVVKQTELLGGAYGVDVAPGGHVFYTGTTGHGYRILGVPASQLKEEELWYPGVCGADPTACFDTERYLLSRPVLADVAAASRRYSGLKSQMPLSLWPVLRTTDRNVEAGTGFFFGDYSEAHYLEGQATFGKDTYVYLTYFNSVWWPNIMVGYQRYTYKGTYGYGYDQDGLPETDDLQVVDLKFEQASDDLWAYVTYQASPYLWMGVGADGSRYSFRDTGDGSRFVPYQISGGVSAFLEWSPHDPWYSGEDWINPRGSRRLYLDWSFRGSQIVDPEIAGGVYDDGELMDRYAFHRIMASYTEFIPITWGGLVDRHTLQIDLEFGWISRNVLGWDEFIAGGRHPYLWGNGTIGNNVQFSGYEGWSLYGETMLIANAAYRFPLARQLDLKVGPVYTESVWLQVFGSVGNLWSYRVEGDTHLEGYSVVPDDPATIRREVPFKDYASKNSVPGKPNYVLTDVGAELRVRSFIWNDWDWDSFVRVAYGLRPTAGYGDVNADLVQSSVARESASELSSEYEPPMIRVYVGIGTGW